MTSRFTFIAGLVAILAIHVNIPSNSKATFSETSRTVYFENGTIRVGVDKDWGGAVRELWYKGTNLINNHDGGRLAGISVYDGEDTYNSSNINDPLNWGWNPTPSDKYNHKNRPLEYEVENETLYVKTRNLHWNPDNKGGSSAKAVASDLMVEMWLSFVPDHPNALQARFRATFEGTEDHGLSQQEFPFTYINRGFDRVVSYSGTQPWTGGSPQISPQPPSSPANPFVVATENWVAFVNGQDEGLMIFAPYHYPLMTASAPDDAAPHSDDTNYAAPLFPHAYTRGSAYEVTVFYIVGRWQEARATAAALRQALTLTADMLPPFGTLDEPQPGKALSGDVGLHGWAVDNVGVSRVEVFLDGQRIGEAQYGSSRQDVAHDYPALPGAPNFGFQFQFNVNAYPPGAHEFTLKLSDAAGNSQTLGPRSVTFNTTSSSPIGYLDVADNDMIAGWAYDPDLGVQPVQVVIAVDGKDAVTVTANQDRPDLRSDPRVRGTLHGFSLGTKSLNLKAGTYTVQAYATDSPSGHRVELSDSPKALEIQ